MPFDTLQLTTCIKYDIYLYYCRKQAGLKTWNPIYSRNACDAFASPCAISPRRRASKDKVHRILKGKSDARQSSLRALDDRLQERETQNLSRQTFLPPSASAIPRLHGKRFDAAGRKTRPRRFRNRRPHESSSWGRAACVIANPILASPGSAHWISVHSAGK